MDGQTVQALIDALKKCDPDKLVILRAHGIKGFANIYLEPTGVEETPENVYIDGD